MPQTKESFLKGRTTQFLIAAFRAKWQYEYNDIDTFNLTEWNRKTTLGDKDFSFVYTFGELKDELDKRPHISHKRERKCPHKFPENKRKKKN